MIAWQMCRNSFSHSWCGRPIYMCSKCNLDRLFIFVLVPNKNETWEVRHYWKGNGIPPTVEIYFLMFWGWSTSSSVKIIQKLKFLLVLEIYSCPAMHWKNRDFHRRHVKNISCPAKHAICLFVQFSKFNFRTNKPINANQICIRTTRFHRLRVIDLRFHFSLH